MWQIFMEGMGGEINPPSVKPYSRANYTASSSLGASYLKLDGSFTKNLFFHIGGRLESNSQLASNVYYKYFEGFRNPQAFPLDQNTKVTAYNFLPSASLNFKPLNNLNINAGYFKTINRPQLQELIKYAYYDAVTFNIKTGNPLLSAAVINNFNAGVGFIANAFTAFSVNGFYKKIDQPVEYIVSGYGLANQLMTPHNMPAATVKGIDASFRLKLNFLQTPFLSGVEIFGNGNLTKSKVDAGPVRDMEIKEVKTHRLSGSPEYSFNTGLVIQQTSLPQLTILYSRTGDYLKALGSGKLLTLANGNTISAIPDYWVKGRDQLDIQLSQKLFKSKLQIIAGVNNLTASGYTEYQDLNGNKKFDSPLVLKNNTATGGYFVNGTDNTLISIRQQRLYYVTLSYLFK
jgi:outer membrane receptor protein involved in Fe transport